MSDEDNSELHLLRRGIQWLTTGIVGLLVGAFGMGMWVAGQQSEISDLRREDAAIKARFLELQNMVASSYGSIRTLEIANAGMNADLTYIRMSVTEIKDSLKKNFSLNGNK